MTRGDGTLTPRQLEVLTLLARGWSTQDIAAHLWLSAETIRYHAKCAYRNLGVHNRADAIALIRQDDSTTLRCPTCGTPITRRT